MIFLLLKNLQGERTGLDVSGPSGDCVLKIGPSVSNKKREKDFACRECVIIQSL